MRFRINLVLICFLLVSSVAYSYNLKQISNRDGLSNSAVLCLFQDNDRFLWVGTYDGLNMYDGRSIQVYKPTVKQKSLSSNVIKDIIETQGNYLWISTKWGLNKFSRKKNVIEEVYNEFRDKYYIAKDSKDHFFVLGKQGVLSYYSEKKKGFIDIPLDGGISNLFAYNLIIDENDTIWITQQGVIKRFTIDFTNEEAPVALRQPDFVHKERIANTHYSDRKFIFVDGKGDLYVIKDGKSRLAANITPLLGGSDIIASMIFDGDDILIGCSIKGLLRLQANKNYRAEKIDINCGVFSLWKDKQQDIIWIGTDGQGVFAYTKEEYTFHNIVLDRLPIKKKRPVRSIYTDEDANLWLGTKNNGIIRIKNYTEERDYTSDNVSHYTTENGLPNDAVFAFLRSSKNILWICSDGPNLCYYSYKDSRIHTLANCNNKKLQYMHAIHEASDSVLWIGTDEGLLKVSLSWKGDKPEMIGRKAFMLENDGKRIGSQVSSIYPENDSILWVATRGHGVYRFNVHNETGRNISFDRIGIPAINDVLCILKDKKERLWFGTCYGLIRLDQFRNEESTFTSFNENNGLPNNTIHGIKEDGKGYLWLSSNTGIIQFNTETKTARQFNYKNGLDVFEFSDNAYYQSPFTGSIFFGGVNGIVWLHESNEKKNALVPDMFFRKLRVFNEDFVLDDFIKGEGDARYLQLNYDQNFFSISFVAMDYINGANCSYSYMLENFSNVWMETSNDNEAHFTNIPPGKYVLKVRYNSGLDGSEDQCTSMIIVIRPPWYQSIYARVLYWLLIMGATCYFFYVVRKRNEKKRALMTEKLEEKHKEEVYEEKLRFFTNITHEFCTPLTLIYGPCERILGYENTDSFIRKYIMLIKSNTERLNSLIQEVIEFRRMETGHKTCNIQHTDVNELTDDIFSSFSELADRNNILFKTEVVENLFWNTDRGCLTKILNNLISNAFKYTPVDGTIRIQVSTENNRLVMRVYNTGKGIKEDNMELIFNRYSILDNIEENAIKGLSSRNGLGMAICHSMVELLKGDIRIESEVNQYAEFVVTLPQLAVTLQSDGYLKNRENHPEVQRAEGDNIELSSLPREMKVDRVKTKVLVIDDNKEILWLIQEVLEDEYQVLTATDGEKGLNILKTETPELIITDIMMPGVDGIELTRQIKQNKHTMHIPLVILSAKNANEERIEGLESGADIYVSKPFKTNYLKAVVHRLIENRNKLKEYYNSSASAYEFSNGQLMQKEDKDFLQTVVKFIDESMDNTDLSPEDLADFLQISVRNLYRKFKELDQLTPKDFIKDYRINFAAKLLKTTTLTIQEVIYRSGFNNRSHFYKEFDKRFGITPKEYREMNRQKDDTLS